MNPFMCRREAWLELTVWVSPVGVGQGKVHGHKFIRKQRTVVLAAVLFVFAVSFFLFGGN
ncbi:MAG: hypothetical protein HPY66_1174 [Firmicutes bacterium]|nr:hypothetical protein [Bacillota bacterium]